MLDHPLWPAACLVSGGLYLDTGGREWAKLSGVQAHGIAIGAVRERMVAYGVFSFFIVTGLMAISVGLLALA